MFLAGGRLQQGRAPWPAPAEADDPELRESPRQARISAGPLADHQRAGPVKRGSLLRFAADQHERRASPARRLTGVRHHVGRMVFSAAA